MENVNFGDRYLIYYQTSSGHTCLPSGREYERQIDQMGYKLYGLTQDEIAIVENSG